MFIMLWIMICVTLLSWYQILPPTPPDDTSQASSHTMEQPKDLKNQKTGFVLARKSNQVITN